MVAWHSPHHPLPPWCPTPTSRHHGLRTGFIQKDQGLRRLLHDLRPPLGPGRGILLGGDQGLFLSGRPSRASVLLMVDTLRGSCVWLHIAQCSASVASGWAATCSRSTGSSSRPTLCRGPGARPGSSDAPAACLRFHRLMLFGLTPVVCWISAGDRPDVTARTNRSRRSREYPRGMRSLCHHVNPYATRSRHGPQRVR